MGRIKILNLKWNAKIGGSLEHFVQVGKNLDPEKFSVKNVCVINYKREKPLKILNEINSELIPLKWKYDITVIPKLVKIIRREQIDIVYMVENSSTFVMGFTKLITKGSFKLVFNSQGLPIHDTKLKQLIARCFSAINIYFMKYLASKVVVASKGVRKTLMKRGIGEEKICVIYNAIDLKPYKATSNIKEKRKELGLDRKFNLVGIVARLTPVKGIEYLIRAMPSVLVSFPDTLLLIVGDGFLREKLEDKVYELGIQKNVIFTGFRSDIPSILKLLDIFVLPSLREGLPFAMLEAMASSKPVIASNVEGNKEVVVDGKTGILVPPKDARSLAKAIISLLADKDKAKNISQEGLSHVEKTFSINKLIKDIEKVLEEV